jgi:flagellin
VAQVLVSGNATIEDVLGDVSTSAITPAEMVGIDQIDIGTQAGAWEAIQRIDSAIDKVNSSRAELGSIQTRFEKSIENIDIMNENLSSARGRIMDADFASETANLSRTQILQQAGTAMVAQANQLPQQVLSLLR